MNQAPRGGMRQRHATCTLALTRLLLAMQLALGLAACFDPSYPTEIPCSENQSCPPGQTCDVDGICRYQPLPPGGPDARRDPDSGSVTVPDAQRPPDAMAPCTGDDQCPGGQVCRVDGMCVDPACNDDRQNGDESDVDCGGQTCPPCGDGATCDNGDDCASGVCELEGGRCAAPRCGDGVTRGGEACDTSGESATCDVDCTAANCGDGTHNATAGETCDTSGNSVDCDQDCTTPECGDNVRNPFVETCDEGAVNTASCDFDCTIPQCGDDIFNSLAEICDEGANTEDCDQDCTRPQCGDVFINPVVGEACDAGGNNSICDSDCTFAACGDSFFNPEAGEACDTGGNSASCDSDCTTPRCGDGFINPAFGEECDDGGTANGDGCSASCVDEFPAQCTTGTDPLSGAGWTVCDANNDVIWISSLGGGGQYRTDLICQSLGYSTLIRFGGNCGSVCGFCESGTSCSTHGARTFQGSGACPTLPTLCNTVTWECGR